MKITNVLNANVASALVGQKTLPNIYIQGKKKFKKTRQVPKKAKSVYGTGQGGSGCGAK